MGKNKDYWNKSSGVDPEKAAASRRWFNRLASVPVILAIIVTIAVPSYVLIVIIALLFGEAPAVFLYKIFQGAAALFSDIFGFTQN
ncbi:MAG: hypothetical protein AAGK66_06840 [Pseudomonadota bacterium]